MSPMILDLFGHFSYLLIGLGTYFVARKNTNGWWMRAGGDLGWVIIGVYLGLSSIVLWEGAFFLADISFGYKWHGEERNFQSTEEETSRR